MQNTNYKNIGPSHLSIFRDPQKHKAHDIQRCKRMTLSTTAIFRNVDISGLYPRHETREADAERRTMQKHQMHVNFISERFIVDKW